MDKKIYITGHKNPDTDSIASAIAYSELKNKINGVNSVPIRLGEVNRETEFVLDYFGIEKPEYMDTIKPRVSDLIMDPGFFGAPDISLAKAIDLIKSNHNNNMAVVDGDNKMVGIVSLSNITNSYLDIWDDRVLKNSETTIENIIETLSCDVVLMPKNIRPFESMKVYLMSPESENVNISKGDIVIVGDRIDSHLDAINKGVSVLILSGGFYPSEEVLKEAEKNEVVILATNFNSFMTARLLPQSIPISYVMTKKNIITFEPDDFIEDVRKIMSENRYRSYPVVDSSGHVIGNISRFHLISNPKRELILVDHNERNQSIPDIDHARVIEIIDHHRIANITTDQPIYFRNEIVGSTSTIIASMYIERGIMPSRKIAGLLASAIISDTLLLKSPTTTELDVNILSRLEKFLDININKFAEEMFRAGTSLENKDIKDLLKEDVKDFLIHGESIKIAQVMTMDFDSLDEIKDSLIDEMLLIKDSGGYTDFIFILTDILKEASKIIIVGRNSEIISKEFGEQLVDNAFLAKGVLSRKKQVIPNVTNAILKK